jgi:calcineurin-like phosphoesterase family protein
MSNTWFCADTHLGHCNIIKYCNRPWKTFDEMDEGIIQRFQEVIRQGDTLYHLGDVCHSRFPINKFLDRLPNIQVHLIYGNHDKPKLLKHPKIVWAGDTKTVHLDKPYSPVLFHYPIRSWNHKGHGSFHFYGHCHGKVPGLDRSMDVGVDTNNYYPYNWDFLVNKLKDIPYYTDKPKNINIIE